MGELLRDIPIKERDRITLTIATVWGADRILVSGWRVLGTVVCGRAGSCGFI